MEIAAATPFTFALVAFVMQEAAYESEVIRAALLSVDRKETEAAKSIGMTGLQTLWRITIPQALVVAIPSFGNALTSLIKGTSLAFIISVMDMMGKAKVLGGRNFHYFEAYICAALTYWIICGTRLIFTIAIKKPKKMPNRVATTVSFSVVGRPWSTTGQYSKIRLASKLIIVDFHMKPGDLYFALLPYGIMVRGDFSMVRISIGTPEQNSRLLDASWSGRPASWRDTV